MAGICCFLILRHFTNLVIFCFHSSCMVWQYKPPTLFYEKQASGFCWLWIFIISVIGYLFSLCALHLLHPLSTDTVSKYLSFYFLIGLVNCQSSHTVPPHKPPVWLEISSPGVKHLPLLQLLSHMLLNIAFHGRDQPTLGGGWEHGRQAPRESLTSVLYNRLTTLC